MAQTSGIPLDTASIVSTVLEGMLYGKQRIELQIIDVFSHSD
jgi:hypothetical protein